MTQYFIKLEMIYLHHQSLANIIGNKERICANDKLIIHTYRHTLLTQFCQNHNLSIPIYDKYNNGKPYCQNIPSLAFNHSHSQNNYTLIYGLNIKNIGVDIEDLDRQLKFEPLAKRYFHDDEYLLWQNNDFDKITWFKLWTIKEAILKAYGIGIRLSLKELNASFITDNSGFVSYDKIGTFYFKNILVNSSMITVACEEKEFDIIQTDFDHQQSSF